MPVNPIKAAGDELYRMELAIRMVSGGRCPAWGAASWVRHRPLRNARNGKGIWWLRLVDSTDPDFTLLKRTVNAVWVTAAPSSR
jgi:hypothetical protein